jgi:hypothetical protein
MIRKNSEFSYFFICECGESQAVVKAENADAAVSLFVDMMMDSNNKIGISEKILLRKINPDLLSFFEDNDVNVYSSVVALADSGYHNESQKLKNFLNENK